MTATVKVVNGRYKPNGAFHTIEANQPIRKEDGKLCGVTNPRYMVYIHSYGGEAPFFAGLAEGRLLASRCDNPDCEDGYKSINMPYRIHCPDCLVRCTEVDITNIAYETAKVHTFMITERTGAFNTLDKPVRFINVEFEGVSTILMSYLLVDEPKIGMRVVPIFKTKEPTHTIADLAWVPEGTPADELPEGFTYSKR